ncbi:MULTISPECIES: MFS transporter [Enterobacterales]|jgi:MFS family permease|uniref:MFS transporter n=1 Tax=Enterobacterales TaxID=91347 RepID=UPI00064CFE83|nr:MULTISPECIES: MFS transporter [Enterobacterales]ELS0727536.1 MFS transporter [Klebsiella michiganensis]MBE3536791.1 MFS transporter [Enterobacter cloacae complex sp. I3]MCB3584521.1 MFS transporter [Klebsiella pneumoniae]HBU6431332.1 MFS transporter [Klebsiella oxytoca]HCM9239628.1 MFS transporter [Enterobacter hormaechei subsp. steigerwaltii]
MTQQRHELSADHEAHIASAIGKFFRRIIPMLALMLIINQIDRANIGFVKAQLQTDAGISAAAFGLGAGLFFIGYALFEVPSNMMLKKFGARVWLTRIMITWGTVVVLTGFVSTPMHFYMLRFLLGVAEAGFFPGVLFYFRQWVPNAWRGRATAMVLSATASAFLFSGPLTGAILMMHDVGGLAGWKWVMFLEGGGSIVIGLLAAFVLVSKPEGAKWLSDAEKQALAQQLAIEDATRDERAVTQGRWGLITDRSLIFYCLIFFTMTMTGYTLVFWLPQIIQRIQGFNSFESGLLTAIPWLFAIVALFLLGKATDRYRDKLEKGLGIAMLIAACGTFMATLGTPWFGFVAMIVACIGSKVSAAFFWPMPQSELPVSIAAPGIAMINSVGNLGGFFAPTVFGYLEMHTGSTTGGLYALTSVSVVTGLWLLLRTKPVPPALGHKERLHVRQSSH